MMSIAYFPFKSVSTANRSSIKKAYRRKALELHPDRNFGDVENATRHFAEVQSAYQVLSDPHERAWYDSHRDAILRDDHLAEDHFEHNIRVTSAQEIINLISKFTSNIPFTDTPNGFFGILRSRFAALAKEEDAACEWEGLELLEYPDFGVAEDTYEDTVRNFYSIWMAFGTKKTFSWKDAYNYAEAPDRRIRRLMEKENKRLRDEAIKEFNDAVRSLVSFVRKRDPRYTPNIRSDEERQKILRDATASQAARARAAHQAHLDKHTVPHWARTQEADREASFSESEQSEEEHFECVTCGKIFKSENQYESHEKSKKHIKAVQQLKWQMKKDDKSFGLNKSVNSGMATSESDAGASDTFGDAEQAPLKSGELTLTHINSENITPGPEIISQPPSNDNENGIPDRRFTASQPPSNDEEHDDDYAPREDVESRLWNFVERGRTPSGDVQSKITEIEDLTTGMESASIVVDGAGTSGGSTPKLGKAKAKRVKKAARQKESEQLGQSVSLSCNLRQV